MIEGENKVSAEFEISQSEVSYILGLIEDAKNGNFEDIFSLKNLLTLISWAISLFMGSGFCITLLKSKKIKAQTLVDNVLTGVGKYQTSVVLLHDAANKNTTVEALPAIIEEIQAMDDTVLLPVSDDMEFVQHLKLQQSTAQQ